MAKPEQVKHYCPSSGSEQMWFEDIFCENCPKMGKDGKPPHCMIWSDMMIGKQRDEWCYIDENPTCTGFQTNGEYNRKLSKRRDEKLIKLGQTYF